MFVFGLEFGITLPFKVAYTFTITMMYSRRSFAIHTSPKLPLPIGRKSWYRSFSISFSVMIYKTGHNMTCLFSLTQRTEHPAKGLK